MELCFSLPFHLYAHDSPFDIHSGRALKFIQLKLKIFINNSILFPHKSLEMLFFCPFKSRYQIELLTNNDMNK